MLREPRLPVELLSELRQHPEECVAIEGAETSVDPDDETTDYTADDTNNDVSVDMTDLEPFLGFMSETAYEELKTQLVQICQERNCSSVRKLTYQQTQAFDVTSFYPVARWQCLSSAITI